MLLLSKPSQIQKEPPKKVLIIDDEVALLEIVGEMVEMFGYEVKTASRVSEAEKILTVEGTNAYHCVLTDYQMPEKTGLEMLRWLRKFDQDLSIVVYTAFAKHENVSAMMREGAVDILAKPVKMHLLEETLKAAVAKTIEKRELSKNKKAVQQVGKIQNYLLDITGGKDLDFLDICYSPLNSAGGDFFAWFPKNEDSSLLVFADVSGHDLDAAFVSSFLNGFIQGMVSCQAQTPKIIETINRFLMNSWNDRDFAAVGNFPPETTIAGIFAHISKSKETRLYLNGMPSVRATNQMGRTIILGKGNAPLGLYDDAETEAFEFTHDNAQEFILWSDGIDDLANAEGIAPEALLYRLLTAEESDRREILNRQTDDILAARIRSNHSNILSPWKPLVIKNYTADEFPYIDSMSDFWNRSLVFALPQIKQDILYAILIASREALLNAMRHGCDKSTHKDCSLTIHYHTEKKRIQVIVEDPGEGYDDPYLTAKETDENKERHSGLILIKSFPDQVSTERNGATVIMDFNLDNQTEPAK